MKKTIAISLVVVALLSACAPSPEEIALVVNQTLTANPTNTAYPTYTPYPSLTPVNTYTPIIKFRLVTATYTPTPVYTPTETSTPSITPTMTATIDKLKASRGNGFYLIGVTIAPGVWLSNGTSNDCYWAVTRKDGDIIDNHFGMAGGTAYVPSYGFQVQFEDCGTWTWLSP